MILVSLLGCMTMDSFFFNGTIVDEYVLGGDIIPPANVEEVTFETSDGWTDYGVWAHADAADAPVFVYFHGNAGNIDEYWNRVELYWQLGFNVFVPEYRGYGKTGGEGSWDTLHIDGEAAVDYVMETTGKPSEELYYHALSLGGVPMLHAAASRPPRAASTEDVFANINMLVDDASDLDLPPGWFVDSEWDNAAAAASVHVPLLIMHGDSDTYINPKSAELIYAEANDPKTLWHAPGADHADTPDVVPEDYSAYLLGWVSGDAWPQ